MFNTPILFLIFNRPDTTKQVFERIREIKPAQLFVAADGPRDGNKSDKLKCSEARAIATNVDWDCEIITLFREENLGCGRAVSSAITWFFEHVEMGIILEDDVLVDLTFFNFCQELLLLYKNNDRIAHIGGANFQNSKKRGDASYYFSKYSHVWGWATWRDCWESYNLEIGDSPEEIDSVISPFCRGHNEKRYWSRIFNNSREIKDISTWDYQWMYYIWKKKGICILPNQNLVENIGFDSNATHTSVPLVNYNKNKVKALEDIKHPNFIVINLKADLFTFQNHFTGTEGEWMKNKLRNLAYKVIPEKFYEKVKKIIKG